MPGVALVNFPYFHSAAEIRDIAERLGLLARLTVADHWAARATCEVMCALRPVLIFLAPRLSRRVPASVARDALRHNFTTFSRTLQDVVVCHRIDPALTALAERPVLLFPVDCQKESVARPWGSRIINKYSCLGLLEGLPPKSPAGRGEPSVGLQLSQ